MGVGFGVRLRHVCACVVIVVALASEHLVFAQPPSAPPPPPDLPPRLEASGQFTFLDTSGNASTRSIGGGGDFIWRPNPWTYNGKAIFAQSESEGELTARSLAALFRTSRSFNSRLSVYGQYDYLRDVFAGIDQRHVIEGGLSYLAADRAPHRLQFDAGLGYLDELGREEDLDSATVTLAASYRLAAGATTRFTYEPRFLIPVTETESWKFDQDAAFTIAINSFLSLKLTHTLRYSANPPPDFETTDRILTISLVAKIRRPE